MEEKYIVAIEIGSSKVRGALAVIEPNSDLNVIAVETEHISDSVRYGQVKNIDDVSTKIASIRTKLEGARAIQPRKIEAVYVGLNGFSVASSNTTDQITFPGETDITADVVKDFEKRISSSIGSQRDLYDMLPVEYAIDNEKTLNAIGRVGTTLRGTYSIISGAPGLRTNINRVICDRLGMKINRYVVSMAVLGDTVLSADQRQLGCVLVDFGAETTSVAIYKGGVLRSMVTLPMGSRNITSDLMSLNYLEEQAESIKQSVGIPVPSDKAPQIISQYQLDLHPDVTACIQSRAGEIIANVNAQIERSGFKAADLPAGIIITGGGSRLKGFSDLLADITKMKVTSAKAPAKVVFADASISPDDAIDVIAILCAAAVDDPQSCVSEPVEKVEINSLPFEGDEDDDDGEVRIGRDDDDDILDDDDDDDEPRKPKTRKPHGAPRSPGIISRISERLRTYFSEIDNTFDDEDDEQ